MKIPIDLGTKFRLPYRIVFHDKLFYGLPVDGGVDSGKGLLVSWMADGFLYFHIQKGGVSVVFFECHIGLLQTSLNLTKKLTQKYVIAK